MIFPTGAFGTGSEQKKDLTSRILPDFFNWAGFYVELDASIVVELLDLCRIFMAFVEIGSLDVEFDVAEAALESSIK